MNTQRRISFLVVCILGFYGEILGQKNSPNEACFSGFVRVRSQSPAFVAKFRPRPFFDYTGCTPSQVRFTLLNVPTPAYYPNSLGFICRKELQLDKITPIPFRFRLGSLEYVNWLEQKPNSRRY
jgi:hypothetical protein